MKNPDHKKKAIDLKCQSFKKIISQIESQKKFGKMKWSVDVDPTEVLRYNAYIASL
jgi:hypothetical protein